MKTVKSNQEILDNYGRLLVRKCFDNQLRFIMNDLKDLSETKGYENLFSGMSAIQKKEMEHYTYSMLKGALFDFLRIFEEDDEYKLYYEKDGQRVDLKEISEMLKAEPIIETGWIARFSEKKGGNY